MHTKPSLLHCSKEATLSSKRIISTLRNLGLDNPTLFPVPPKLLEGPPKDRFPYSLIYEAEGSVHLWLLVEPIYFCHVFCRYLGQLAIGQITLPDIHPHEILP
jgi:hypothetical protein